jgi:hypothetical protein
MRCARALLHKPCWRRSLTLRELWWGWGRYGCPLACLVCYRHYLLDLLTRRKGQSMTEEGTLSIVRHEKAYKVRYASNNPHTMDQRQPYMCTDAEHLEAFLHHCGSDPWSIHQACAELRNGRQGGVAVLSIVLSAAQVQASFPALLLCGPFRHERPGRECTNG